MEVNELSEKAHAAVAENSHQLLFYALCSDLKKLAGVEDGEFRKFVSVKSLLQLECLYAEAEYKMRRSPRGA